MAEKEYIEREVALKLLNRNSITKHITFADDVSIYDTIKNIPAADVVEVVRCKDCAHAVEHKYSPVFFKCDGCSFLKGRLVSSNFYCKCGERRRKNDTTGSN